MRVLRTGGCEEVCCRRVLGGMDLVLTRETLCQSNRMWGELRGESSEFVCVNHSTTHSGASIGTLNRAELACDIFKRHSEERPNCSNEGDDIAKSTLRMALSAITNAEVAGDEAVELSDDQVVKVLQAESKKRAESAELYEQAGRADAAAQERAEAEILATYLPAAMSDDELAQVVADEVAKAAAAGNAGMKAMGMVVKAVRERVGSSADGSKIADLVKSALA